LPSLYLLYEILPLKLQQIPKVDLNYEIRVHLELGTIGVTFYRECSEKFFQKISLTLSIRKDIISKAISRELKILKKKRRGKKRKSLYFHIIFSQ